MSGLRVLALVTDAFGGHGGMSQYNRDFLAGLSRSDDVGHVVVLPRYGAAGADALPQKVRQLTAAGPKARFVAAALETDLRYGPFDLVFCGHLFTAPLAAALAARRRVPLWLQTHGIEAWEPLGRMVRASTERAALITAVSRYTRAKLLDWANIDPARVRVLPNTVRPFFSPGRAPHATRAKYGLIGRRIVVTVSRIRKDEGYKGHATMIRAMASVRASCPDALYLVVGDGDARPGLEALAGTLGVSDAVRFVGRVDDEELLAIYRSAHVFAMPSTGEGFGIVFLEAAATGLPVIAGNSDGSVDALADGTLGTLIDPRSVESVAQAIRAALESEARPDHTRVARFGFDHFAHQVDGLVRSLH